MKRQHFAAIALVAIGLLMTGGAILAPSLLRGEAPRPNGTASYEAIFLDEFPGSPIGDPRYDSAVAEAREALKDGRLEDSLAALERARAVPLFEVPNEALLPQIAYLKLRLGDRDGARSTAAVASAVFEINGGMAKCPRPGEGDRLSGVSLQLTRREEEEVVRTMCGEIYLGLYDDPLDDTHGDYLTRLAVVKYLLSKAAR